MRFRSVIGLRWLGARCHILCPGARRHALIVPPAWVSLQKKFPLAADLQPDFGKMHEPEPQQLRFGFSRDPEAEGVMEAGEPGKFLIGEVGTYV